MKKKIFFDNKTEDKLKSVMGDLQVLESINLFDCDLQVIIITDNNHFLVEHLPVLLEEVQCPEFTCNTPRPTNLHPVPQLQIF